MSDITNVLVVGASGRIGSRVLHELLKTSLDIHVLTRSQKTEAQRSTVSKQEASNSTLSIPSNIPSHQTDYSEQSLVSIFREHSIDVIVSCVSAMPDAVSVQGKLIDAALQTSVKLFIPSEFALDTWNSKCREMTVGIFQNKWGVLQRLEKLSDEGKLDWAAIVNGVFFDLCIHDGELDVDLDKKKMTVWKDGGKVCACTMPFVGRAVAGLVERYSEDMKYGNKVYYVAEAVFTPEELLEFVKGKVPGTWNVEHTTIAEQLELARMAMEKGDIVAAIRPLCMSAGWDGSGGDFTSQGRQLSNAELGLPEPSLDRAWKGVEDWEP